MATESELAARKEAAKKRMAEMTASLVDMDTAEVRAKVLLYGVKGTGKSVKAAHLASKLVKPDEKIVYVDTSEGWVSVKNHPSITKDADFKVLPFQSFDHLVTLASAIRKQIAPFDNVGAVILDEFSKMVMFQVIDIARRNHEGSSIPDWDDWRELANDARQLLKLFFSIPGVHIIALAHERMTTTGGKNPVVVWEATPDFNPSASKVICEDMHVVARMTAQEVKAPGSNTPQYTRAIQMHPTFRIDTKCRVGGFGITTTDKDFTKQIVTWINSGAPESDPMPQVNVAPVERIMAPNTDTDIEPDIDDDPYIGD